jgi:hypothetical protein
VVVVPAGLVAVVTATRAVSVLGATVGGRVLWAVLVMGGGTVGWALGWALTDVAGLVVSGSPLWTFLLGGVPFALVAGMFVRDRPVSAAAVGLSLLLLVTTVVVLRHESPDELESRMATNGVHRETAYAVAVPGYRPTDRDFGGGRGGGSFRPSNPDAVPPDRYIDITEYDRVVPGGQMCGQPTALDSRLASGDCALEPGGLVYRDSGFIHGYQVAVGGLYVTVVGTAAVDRDLLRAAALSLHPAPGGHYAATIPGYAGQVTGSPPGMRYAPAEHTGGGAQSVSITLYVSYAASDSICFETTECTPDGDGLTYVRTEDTHGYVARRGEVDVRVMGGLRVSKALLHQAALDARPATDDELARALPPLAPRNFLDRLRRLLRG